MAVNVPISGTVNYLPTLPILTENPEFNILCNTSSVATVFNIPAVSSLGGQPPILNISDASNNASVNTITINTSEAFYDGSTSMVISVNGGSTSMKYNGQAWVVMQPQKFSTFSGTTTLTSAQIVEMHSTGIKLVGAVSGKTIVPTFMTFTLVFNSTPYVMAAGGMYIAYGSNNTAVVLANSFITATKSEIINATTSAIATMTDSLLDLATYQGADLKLKIAGGGVATAGNSTIIVNYEYKLV